MRKILNFIFVSVLASVISFCIAISFYNSGAKDVRETIYRDLYILPGYIRTITDFHTIIETRNGRLWSVNTVEGDEVGKSVTILFNTNGTQDPTDDRIVQVAY